MATQEELKEDFKEKIKQIKEIKPIKYFTNFKRKDLGEIDYNDLTMFDGVKAYTLIHLYDLINLFQEKEKNDNEIMSLVRHLYDLAESPKKVYKNIIKTESTSEDKAKVKQSKKLKKIKEYALNNTERAVLKSKMGSILLQYATKNTKHESIDYTTCKILSEFCYQAIYLGLDEKRVSKLELFVGENGTLVDYKIEYKINKEKYNLNKYIVIVPYWYSVIKEDESKYSYFRDKYKYFSDNTLNFLMAAEATEDLYKDEEDKIKGYNGIVLNYIAALEIELKRIINKKENIQGKDITLKGIINTLNSNEYGDLSRETTIKEIEELVESKNKIAKGHIYSIAEFEEIKDKILTSKIFDFIQWELNEK